MLKQAFCRYCESKAKLFLEQDIKKIQKNLLDGNYQTIDIALEDIELIKKRFYDEGPKFDGARQILSEICSQLIVKVATYVSISGR